MRDVTSPASAKLCTLATGRDRINGIKPDRMVPHKDLARHGEETWAEEDLVVVEGFAKHA